MNQWGAYAGVYVHTDLSMPVYTTTCIAMFFCFPTTPTKHQRVTRVLLPECSSQKQPTQASVCTTFFGSLSDT